MIGRGLKMDKNKAAFIRYATVSTAGWVLVVSLKYTTVIPASKQIEADLNAGRNRVLI